MRITEGQLRRIVREELREMRDPHYKELKSRIAASQASRGYVPPTRSMLSVERDINTALSDVGAASKEAIIDMLGTKHEPTSIMSALSNMMRKGDIDKDESGAYHITGYEEYSEPGRRFLEGRTLLGDVEISTDTGIAGLTDPGEVADDIVRSLGRAGAKSLHDDVMAGDPAAEAELRQMIADVSGGMVDLDDPKNFRFTERVLRAMKQAFSVNEPGEYKGRASSGKELPPMVTNLMDDILIKLENHPRGQTRRALEIWLSGSEDRRRPLYLDQALNALLRLERITQDDAGVFKISARAPTMADITKRVFGSLD